MLSTRQIAEQFNVSPRTVVRWIQSGQLTAYKTGKDYRIEEADFEAFKLSIKKGE